ncbi:Phosphorylated CTD interacting factor 1 WW domain containing protein [Novymonas esmeraldas]|uniref:Phosphorylated CTD interacting factor 1 WW domain containing protein n=1 Tax=Novymonas esmeraldas TaxID=1808958 RepID=A0AAW0EKX2_9TRYP
MGAERRHSCQSGAAHEALPGVLEELLRYRASLDVHEELQRLCAAHLPASPSCDARGLLPAAIFEGQQSRATTPQHLSPGGEAAAHDAAEQTRSWVHPIIDVRRHAEVVELVPTSPNASVRLRLVAVKHAPGELLGVVEPADSTGDVNAAAVASSLPPISLARLRLLAPEPLYHDALLPAVEAIEPHRASKNMLDLWLNKLCGAANKMSTSFNQKRKKAWQLTDEATYVFYVARRRLAERLQVVRKMKDDCAARPPWEIHVCVETEDARLLEALGSAAPPTPTADTAETAIVVVNVVRGSASADDWASLRAWLAPPTSGASVVWALCEDGTLRLRVPIDAIAALRLHARFVVSRGTATLATTDCFLRALACLLLRYHGLCGGDMEKESGWHAAVPPSVMDVFEQHHHRRPQDSPSLTPSITVVECFASPFNATRRCFFSAFHDTDAPFGSLGNFFACPDAASCLTAATARRGSPHSRCCSPDAVVETTAAAAEMPPARQLLRLECNPPFDHEVIAAAFAHLLRWVDGPSTAATPTAVSILVIIPDSSQAHAAEVRAALETSRFCRWVRSLPPPDCLYVHGAQQQQQQQQQQLLRCNGAASTLPRAPRRKRPRGTDSEEDGVTVSRSGLVQLSCPTRVMVVQDDEAERVCTGAAIGDAVCLSWGRVSHEVGRSRRNE